MFFKKSISLLLTVITFCFSFVYNVSAFDNDNDIILQTLLSLQNLMMKKNLLTVITVKPLERLPTIHTIPPNIMSLIIFILFLPVKLR
jgi:hypothetical protein